MRTHKAVHSFFMALSQSLPDLRKGIVCCQEGTRTEDSLTKVLAAATNQVIGQMDEYMDYFEEEIGKGIGGRAFELERERIDREILSRFRESLANLLHVSGDTGLDDAVRAVGDLISDWAQFDKETKDGLLRQFVDR